MTKPVEAITVRGLEPGTKGKLRALAAERGRSMEAEVRDILKEAIERRRSGAEADDVDLGTAIRRRFAKYGGVEVTPPARWPDREPPDFSE